MDKKKALRVAQIKMQIKALESELATLEGNNQDMANQMAMPQQPQQGMM